MLAAVRLSVATVAVVQDYAERLRYANQTITLIERARRQERRLQRAYRRMRNRQDSIDLASAGTKFAPPEWVAAETQFSDQLYFLILALRQVLRGRDLMGSASGTRCPPSAKPL